MPPAYGIPPILGAVTTSPYAVPPGALASFARDGHVLLPGLLPLDGLRSYGSTSPQGPADDLLAATAAALLGVAAVRAVERRLEWSLPRTPTGPWRPDGDRLGPTEPLLTMWLPLQDTGVDLGTPQYAPGTATRDGSDRFLAGIDAGPGAADRADGGHRAAAEDPVAAGDASCHGGWTAYRMLGNTTTTDRLAALITWTPA